MGYVQDIRKKIGHDALMIVGAGVFVYKDGKLLLQKRADNQCWAIHGGCMEIGESAEAVAKRELYEETGLTANSLEFFAVYSGEDMIYTYPNGDKTCIVAIHYICRDFSGEDRPQISEVSQLQWFDINSLPQPIHLPDRRPLQDFIQYVKREN